MLQENQSKYLVVTKENISQVLQQCSLSKILSLDTETTGLRLDREDRLFAIVICDGTNVFYFNFNTYPNNIPVLTREDCQGLNALFDSDITWFIHNAKFDMWALYREGYKPLRNVWCTQALARLEYNEHLKYSLDECVKRIGFFKSDAVEKFIQKHMLFEWEEIPGKKTRAKRKFFGRVPFSIMAPYAEADARIAYSLGIYQQTKLSELGSLDPQDNQNILKVAENEKEFTQTCFEMETRGVCIDEAYCKERIEVESARSREASERFKNITGMELIDSNKSIAKAFEPFGFGVAKTEKGNPSFTDAIIKHIKHPAAEALRDYRTAHKLCNSYYRNLLYWATGGVVHPNIRQSGAATGRISITDPALQTIPKKEEGDDEGSKVRRSFIPRPGFCFVEMDYKAMEFRMLVDYACEKELARNILNGMDPHQATADLVGVDRKTAKTISFGLLYGMGTVKLATDLGVELATAKAHKKKYFEALPLVRTFIDKVTHTARQRGFVRNWMGRRSHFPDPDFAYKAVNYVIQGGGADVVKLAMNRMRVFLQGYKSKMLLQIHDAVLFEIHFSEMNIITKLKDIMETAYPHRILPMAVSVEYSFHSWGDLLGGIPSEQEARDYLQGKSPQGFEGSSTGLGCKNPTGVHPGDPGYSGLHTG